MEQTEQMDIGIVGLGVMGSNLALNMAKHGFQVAGYNYTPDLTEKFAAAHPQQNIRVFYDLKAFMASLKRPRRILLMILAGAPVDFMLEQLLPLAEEGDVLMDGGNSFFKDTIRRHDALQQKNLHYFGIGVSGGEKGARNGPALMPGGPAAAYPLIQPILEAIAAKTGPNAAEPCCTYIGPDGSGHYVKMVHNGIEYADMELLAETYLMLKYAAGFDNAQLARTFQQWNQGDLQSYLMDITATIFQEKDDDGSALLDKILDSAAQKGTGRWTSIQAMEQGIDTSMITAACNARITSNLLAERRIGHQLFPVPPAVMPKPAALADTVLQGLSAAKILAYAQGFSLYRQASHTFGWQLDLGKIAGIFRGGCIIQAQLLESIRETYTQTPDLENLIFSGTFAEKLRQNQAGLRQLVSTAALAGIPVPAFASALEYLDGYRSQHVGANLIQAQRDYFGAHTYQRIDQPGSFHHQWHP